MTNIKTQLSRKAKSSAINGYNNTSESSAFVLYISLFLIMCWDLARAAYSKMQLLACLLYLQQLILGIAQFILKDQATKLQTNI